MATAAAIATAAIATIFIGEPPSDGGFGPAALVGFACAFAEDLRPMASTFYLQCRIR
jgi:hypothetical protein